MTYVMSVGVTACWAEWLTPVIRWKDHTEQPVEASLADYMLELLRCVHKMSQLAFDSNEHDLISDELSLVPRTSSYI